MELVAAQEKANGDLSQVVLGCCLDLSTALNGCREELSRMQEDGNVASVQLPMVLVSLSERAEQLARFQEGLEQLLSLGLIGLAGTAGGKARGRAGREK